MLDLLVSLIVIAAALAVLVGYFWCVALVLDRNFCWGLLSAFLPFLLLFRPSLCGDEGKVPLLLYIGGLIVLAFIAALSPGFPAN